MDIIEKIELNKQLVLDIENLVNMAHNHSRSTDSIIDDIVEAIAKRDQALQLQQTGVSGCKTIRNCRECNAEVSCDKDFCDKKCQTAYYR